MKFNKFISAVLSLGIITGSMVVPARAATSNNFGFDVFFNNEVTDVAFVGEKIEARMYGEDIGDITALEFAVKFNAEQAGLISKKNDTAVTGAKGVAGESLWPVDPEGTDPSMCWGGEGLYGVWYDYDFLTNWADATASITVNDDYTWINNAETGTSHIVTAVYTQNESNLSWSGKRYIFDMYMKAEKAGKLGLDFAKKADGGYYYPIIEEGLIVGGAGGTTITPNFTANKFEILEKPADVTNVSFDDEKAVAWEETINRGVEVALYKGLPTDTTKTALETVTVEYGVKASSFAGYFDDTTAPGTYYVGVKAKGCDYHADEVYSGTILVAGHLDNVENVEWDGKTLTWDAVENADGYKIELYENNTLVQTITVTDGTSKDLTEYLISGTYYSDVTAISNNELYLDSKEATSSDPISFGAIKGYASLDNGNLTKNYAGITVTYDGKEYVADANGLFMIPGMIAGKQTIVVDYKFAVPRTVTVNVVADETKQINTADAPINIIRGDFSNGTEGQRDGRINTAIDGALVIKYFNDPVSSIAAPDATYYDLDGDGYVALGELSHLLAWAWAWSYEALEY